MEFDGVALEQYTNRDTGMVQRAALDGNVLNLERLRWYCDGIGGG
jgi:hypothetical protein